ncbi:cation:proton antiporter [Oceanibaculum pacificum]|uniref:Sodium:proton antiporter n=1 Tax=Oceanibaculum pacificum TaxID=580166 RepID=A0A154WGB3_9PROT|nr:cation:proton antiporter [Oceanibaculum pacificum]KZD12570.1 sodium:proton antiporter [Oceanibaculum pacificum]
MQDSAFFELSAYHLAYAAIGGGIILAYWLPRFFSGREPAASALLILAGLVSLPLIPGFAEGLNPKEDPALWETISELAVIVSLFGTGLRIDNLSDYARWRPTIRLLAVVMPLTILAVALLGWQIAGMTFAGAVLLGAVLSPTDPVLAGDVQVGPPTEGGEHPVRFALTTEAGLNDGLAFPFVYLGLILAAEGFAPAGDLLDWFLRDVMYRIAVGALAGAALGWLLGRVLFVLPRGNILADTGAGVVALAGVLFCYGATELIEGYGFIGVFVAGLVLRRTEAEHQFHGQLHNFNEAIEHALTALLLVMIGAAFPVLWGYLDWPAILIGMVLVFGIRPATGYVALLGCGLCQRERLAVAFYGVRGIGSVYYLAYAAGHIEFRDEGALWATVAFTILLSTLVHGLSAGVIVDWVTRARRAPPAG